MTYLGYEPELVVFVRGDASYMKYIKRAIEVLPKCMNDLLKVGIPKQNIRVFDMHQNMPIDELKTYDVVYLTGGRTSYLPERVNDTG